jgi:OmpR-family two-component system manganese-sensing response regulator
LSKILLVEDDIQIGEKLKEWFSIEGGNTFEWVTSGEDALQLLSLFGFDVILLDWMLPGQTGLDVCKQYRRNGGKSKIIFLTGQSDIKDKEQGLDFGGDDYLVKPFDCRELSARIRSVLRRPDLAPASELLQVGDISLDLKSRTITASGKSVQLMPKESKLLEFLLRNPDKCFGSAELSRAIWTSEAELDANTVRSWIRNLRVRLASVGQADFIKTITGSGYRIDSSS